MFSGGERVDCEIHSIPSIRWKPIVDNLTPRLEYIEDSSTCDRDGQLVAEENGEGSLILRWELDDSLPARQGGVITFKARVR